MLLEAPHRYNIIFFEVNCVLPIQSQKNMAGAMT
jgi:hypothetical protein